MYNVKLFFNLLKHYSKSFPREYIWRTNRVKYYYNRISAHVKKYPDVINKFRPQSNLPLEPTLYPYNKEKAKASLKEVRQWILDEEKKGNI